jgi:hypothetical protein
MLDGETISGQWLENKFVGEKISNELLNKKTQDSEKVL